MSDPEDPSEDPKSDRLAKRLFVGSLVMLVFFYGFMAGKMQWFPYAWIDKAVQGVDDLEFLMAMRKSPRALLERDQLPFYFRIADKRPGVSHDDGLDRELTLLTFIDRDMTPTAALVDENGKEVHRWNLDWFDHWEDATHIPEGNVPRSRPGTHIHGAILLEDRKLVFNYEHLGLMCVDREGEVVWKLPYTTHHSVHLDADGNLWVSGQKRHQSQSPDQLWRPAPYDEYTILLVSPEGKLLKEWSVDQLLLDNGYAGLLRLPTDEPNPGVVRDLLHLNDVEPFPQHFEEGFFKQGDVIVSLRNVNTVFVFNKDTERIRYIRTGCFDAQHDPDFIDGNRFSVFDNNRSTFNDKPPSSRIVIVDARDDSIELVYEGTKTERFFTSIMGKHQWLANGNLLITESMEGRAFELDRDRKVVWEYRNYVEDDIVGLLEEAQRLNEQGTSPLPHPVSSTIPETP